MRISPIVRLLGVRRNMQKFITEVPENSSARDVTSRDPWQAAQGAMLSGQRVIEHIILAAFRDEFSLRQPCVPI